MSFVSKSFPINKFNFEILQFLELFFFVFFIFLEKILIKNLLNKKTEKIILEKIYVKIKMIFIYFQSNGFSAHISKGCIPYVIIISFEK